jgi:hypothetical protein
MLKVYFLRTGIEPVTICDMLTATNKRNATLLPQAMMSHTRTILFVVNSLSSFLKDIVRQNKKSQPNASFESFPAEKGGRGGTAPVKLKYFLRKWREVSYERTNKRNENDECNSDEQ